MITNPKSKQVKNDNFNLPLGNIVLIYKMLILFDVYYIKLWQKYSINNHIFTKLFTSVKGWF